jgi:hypothetical protein
LGESRKVIVNEILECEGEVVVDVSCGVHGVKRGGVRSVREEDRHHRQVLVTVELSLVLFHRESKP